MIRKQAEAHFHDATQVRQYLDTALRLTAELDLGDVSPDVFFAQAVNLIAAKQIDFERVQVGVPLDGLAARR